MVNRNQNREWQTTESGAREAELAAALAKFSAVEPRPGIEERILANLQAARDHALNPSRWPRSWEWRWKWSSERNWKRSAAAALAFAIVVVALLWRSEKPAHPLVANHPLPAAEDTPAPPQRVVVANGGVRHVPPATPRPAMNNITHPVRSEVAATPKLEQFPSPQPLNEQERILASYVAHFHQQAVLVARVRNEERERDRMAIRGIPEVADEINETTSR